MEKVKKIVKTFSLCDYTVERLEEISRKKGINMSNIVDFAIEEYYEKQKVER